MTFTVVDMPRQLSSPDQLERARACRELAQIALVAHAGDAPDMPLSPDQQASFPPPAFNFIRTDFGSCDVAENPDQDAYLLVLLADQDLDEGREEQAACLIEAAFSAFDQRHGCHGHGCNGIDFAR